MYIILQEKCPYSCTIIITFLILGIFLLIFQYVILVIHPTTVEYLYGQDVVLLATTTVPISYDSINFYEITQQNQSQVDIYIGNPEVYNESIFKQGNVPSQSSVLVDREYFTPNSILTVQLQPDNENESNFMTTVAIKNFLNERYTKTIVTSSSNFTWTFNESDYYNIWINSSVQLNYTITGEVYRYNASDLTLGCSIPADQQRCSVTQHDFEAFDTNEVYIFGIVSTTRDTITKLSFETVDHSVERFVIIVLSLEGIVIIFIAIVILYLFRVYFRTRRTELYNVHV